MEKAAVEPAVDLAKQHGPYYYAHAAKAWEVPEDAKTISGEGLTHTGQGPRRLDGDAATAGDVPDDASMEGLRQELARLRARLADAARVRRPEAVPLKKYAFADGEETCKIYIEFAAGELRSRRTEEDGSSRNCLDAGVAASFERRRVRVVVVVPNVDGDSRREFAVNLACDIVPKHCSYKVAPEKNRVVVSLRKAEAVPWPTLCAASC
jgi:hypothetical protein